MNEPINSWTDDYENILEALRLNSIAISNFKRKRYFYLKHILQYFRLPVIAIAGINSVFCVGLQPFFEQSTISVINCLLSLLCGIVGSIELYLAIQQSMELELVTSKDYYLLSIDIFKVLSLERTNRTDDAKSFLEEKFAIYEKLIENSLLINKEIKDKLAPLPKLGDTCRTSSMDTPRTNSSETSLANLI